MPAWLLEDGLLEGRGRGTVECVVSTGYPYAIGTADAVAVSPPRPGILPPASSSTASAWTYATRAQPNRSAEEGKASCSSARFLAPAHVDYICQVYDLLNRRPPPASTGSAFVGVEQITAIWWCQQHHPAEPRIRQPRPAPLPARNWRFSHLIISPKVTLVAVTILGMVDEADGVRQGVPVVAATVDARVRKLDLEVIHFHQEARARLAYLPC